MLLQKLHDGDSGVRREATIALGQLADRADPEVIAGLLGRLADRNAAVRKGAVKALAEVGGRGHDHLIGELLQRLEHQVWFVRQAAASALGRIAKKGDGRVASHLATLLPDDNEEVAQAVLESLTIVTPIGDAGVVDALLKRLEQGGTWLVMEGLANALQQIPDHGDEQVKAALIDKISNPREEVRRVALAALPELVDPGDQDLCHSLVALLESADLPGISHDARAAAASLLGRITSDCHERATIHTTISALLACISAASENWLVRRAAIESLAKVAARGDSKVFESLLPCMSDPDHGVRQATISAIAALSTRGDRRCLDAILSVVKSAEELPFLRRAAIQALGSVALVGDSSIVRILLAQLNDPHHSIRDAAAEVLTSVSEQGDEVVLDALLNDLLGED
jgi:HEAT repeat protein